MLSTALRIVLLAKLTATECPPAPLLSSIRQAPTVVRISWISFFIWLVLIPLAEGAGITSFFLIGSSGTVVSVVNSMPLPLPRTEVVLAAARDAILACWIWMLRSRLSPTRGGPTSVGSLCCSETDFFFSKHCLAFAARSCFNAFSNERSFSSRLSTNVGRKASR